MEEVVWTWVKEQFALLQDGLRILLLSWDSIVPALWDFLRENSQPLSHLALVFGVPFLGWRAWAADRQARVANKQALLAEQGHITGRFTKAVEQLGSEKMAVRLGAVYALERLSKDSPEDHWTIMEVLTAYVRDNAPWPPTQAIANPFVELQRGDGDPATDLGEEVKEGTVADAGIRPAVHIHAILNVLGRRDEDECRRDGQAERQLNLQGVDLRGINLNGTYLANADLGGSNLQSVSLFGANLQGALMWGASLQNAFLVEACLRDAVLIGANLSGARLMGVDLTRADFRWKANLHKADLRGANLQEAELGGVDLRGATLWDASFQSADLSDALLQGADLCSASLRGTNLRGANLRGALNMTREQVNEALGDKLTKLPSRLLPPPAHWLEAEDPSPTTPPPSPPPPPEAPPDTPSHTSR